MRPLYLPLHNVCRMPLKTGGFTLIDPEDYDFVAQWTWREHIKGQGYVSRYIQVDGKPRYLLLHRVLLDPPPELEVDHINGDRMDNRRVNLRLATHAQNMWNLRNLRRSKPYIGVFKSGDRYRARISVNNILVSLGSYATPEEAAERYNHAAKVWRGEFAVLNEIRSPQ